tara:strand:- start:600 stop:1679 length:1080 start_codon:yes stop_codon:yes gene_type:complete
MAERDINKATTTDFTNVVPDFIVESIALDVANADKTETYWYFSDATKNLGYYFNIPEIHSAANALATWAFGRGWETDPPSDTQLSVILKGIKGTGFDSFQTIMWNHEVIKLVIGDAFAEIVRNKKGILINLLPISPERVRLVFKGSTLLRYDVWNSNKWKPLSKEKMLHSSNNRVGDSMHGVSKIDAGRWVIDARNEALEDNRKIEHRGMALGIAYYKTNNAGKISYANTQIEQAVKNGEMIGLPEDTVEIKEFPTKSISERLPWIQYLENFWYQIFGVPRSIATSDGTSEVGGKMGHVIFEPIYTKEQTDVEADLWNQMAIKIKFRRPASLGGLVEQDIQKAPPTIQPNDVTANMERE